jgi:pyruvate/2-oxoglutarate/acetoin dehydrogenase E1 component
MRSYLRLRAGGDLPMPYAAHLEAACLPQVEDIVKAAKKIMGKA